MKAVKIILALVALSAVAFFVITREPPPEKLQGSGELTKNAFTQEIEDSIKSFRSNGTFSKQSYKDIKFIITNYYKDKRFSKDKPLSNDQWRRDFAMDLYNAYVAKFLGHALLVFKDSSEWKSDALKFIESEAKELKVEEITFKNAPLRLLVPDSPSEKTLAEIQSNINEYRKINRFINDSCKNFPPTSGKFTTSAIKERMKKASDYSKKPFKLANETFPLCGKTRKELGRVPQILYDNHVKYLNYRVNSSHKKYDEFDSLKRYDDKLYYALRREIDSLNTSLYSNIANVDATRKAISEKWEPERTLASKYFSSSGKEQVIKYLNDNALSESRLKTYKNENWMTDKLKGSIDLCLEFWTLDGTAGKTYRDLLNKVITDDNLKDSVLKKILEKEISSYESSDKKDGLKGMQ
jgi:hypothetical protein